jgi:hypothetical protein
MGWDEKSDQIGYRPEMPYGLVGYTGMADSALAGDQAAHNIGRHGSGFLVGIGY